MQQQRFDLRMQEWIHEPHTKRAYNKALFNEVSSKYDFVTRALSLGQDQTWKRRLVAQLPTLERPKCLDLACGTGDISFALANKYPQGEIIGLDLCESMLELARARDGQRRIQFVMGDMNNTGFESSHLDIVTGGYALRNAPDLNVTLAEIFRVLRPGGTAAFLDFSKPNNKYVQWLQYVVLYTWGSFWGWTLHRNAEVYAYIAESLQLYPDRREMQSRLEQQGFASIRSLTFLLGVTQLLVFDKPCQ